MIKKRYVKRMYVEEASCDECGSPMKFTGVVLTTWPEQYPYNCVNPNCNGYKIFYGDNRPGVLKYEFEDDVNE